jgi:hypothetical protein
MLSPHLEPQSAIGFQPFGQISHGIALGLRNNMTVQPECDARIAVPKLCLHNCDCSSTV